jgi:ERCC4-type nuclease
LWPGALVTVSALEFGDVRIQMPDGDLILIERKTPRDFLDSIKDRRLFNQVAGMVRKTRWAYVLIEGCWTENNGWLLIDDGPIKKSTKWAWHSVQGALLSIQEMGAAIVYDLDTHGAIERIANRSHNDVKIPPRREPHVFSETENILMALPGIGSKKAQEYLELFNDNVSLALMALTAPHDGKNHIPGWGKKSRDGLVRALGGRIERKFDD